MSSKSGWMMPHKHNAILGWDIGGAHIKAVLLDVEGNALHAMQLPCPLWQGLDKLHQAISAVMTKIAHEPVRHAVTMTGELADIFPDRKTGVKEIAAIIIEKFGMAAQFYAGPSGWVAASSVNQHALAIASANWFASASLVASHVENGLFIDIGSTTADLVPFTDGKPCPRGFSDAERMRFEELVYTGVVRTPLMALGPRITFDGESQLIAAEHFATTADVYRITGDLHEADDMAATADGAEKTIQASVRRLARMVGRDLGDAAFSSWVALAQAFRQKQVDYLKDAALRNISRLAFDAKTPIVGAGSGSFLVRELARQLDQPYMDVTELITVSNEALRHAVGICLPAYAVARLNSCIASIKTAV